MRLDSLGGSSKNHALLLFPTFPYTYTRLHSSFFFYYQTVASYCLSLTSCEIDLLRWFLILDCHFIRGNRLPSLLKDLAEHHEPSLRCERPWGGTCLSGMFPFQFQNHSLSTRVTWMHPCVTVQYFADVWFRGRGRLRRCVSNMLGDLGSLIIHKWAIYRPHQSSRYNSFSVASWLKPNDLHVN